MRLSRRIEDAVYSWRNAVFDESLCQVPPEQIEREFQRLCSALLTIGQHETVGLKISQNYRMFLAILACLYTGRKFVPLGLDWPMQRLHLVARLAGIGLILDSNRYASVVGSPEHGLGLMPEGSREPAGGDVSEVAYILFTSGTTGDPKGVMITRKNLEAFLSYYEEAISLPGAHFRVLTNLRYTFDGSLWERSFFLRPKTEMAFVDSGKNIFELAEKISAFRPNHLATTPSTYRLLLAVRDRYDYSSIRSILCGAEPLDVNLLERLREAFPGAVIHNCYGPTECTISTHNFCVPDDFGVSEMSVPVGQGAKHTQELVLDDDGVVQHHGHGELLIGGSQMMKGYVNDHLRESEAFLLHNGVRYYRTGDLCRISEDGLVHIAGRKDETIKRRGFRVNTRSIASLIERIGAVREAYVLAQPDPHVGHKLTAFVVPQDTKLDEARVEALLGEILADIQLPDRIVVLEALPLGSAGKVDRRQLLQLVD